MRNFITDCCYRCGDDITEYEQTEQVGNGLIITYHCNVCGFHGEQHYTLVYTGTVDLDAEEQREVRRRRNEVLCDIRAQNSQEMRELAEKYSKVYGGEEPQNRIGQDRIEQRRKFLTL